MEGGRERDRCFSLKGVNPHGRMVVYQFGGERERRHNLRVRESKRGMKLFSQVDGSSVCEKDDVVGGE